MSDAMPGEVRTRVRFESEAVETGTFEVASFEGEERISAPYRFEVELVSTESAPDAGAILDAPAHLAFDRDGETYRIMVHNFTGGIAEPVVNVYCGGRRVSTFGQPPDIVRNFRGPNGNSALGTMWRVADVTVQVDPATGETTGCDVMLLRRPGLPTGYFLTLNDPTY